MAEMMMIDPYTKNLLTTLGQALIMLANGQLAPSSPRTLAAARRSLMTSDGGLPTLRPGPRARRVYRLSDRKMNLAKMPPSLQEIANVLTKRPNQSLREIMAATHLQKTTVQNMLTQMRKQKLLLTADAE